MSRYFLLFAFVAVLASSVALLAGGGPISDTPSLGTFMEKAVLTNKGDGKTLWTLSARRIEMALKEARLTNVDIDLREQGMQVASNEGVYDLRSRDLTLTGDIRARTEDYSLRTDTVYVKDSTGELTSPGPVVITGQGFEIKGTGLRAAGRTNVPLKSNVIAKFN